ncbi:hypothetical protein [Microbulbifer guangxiensis]|uniref:hypothetical protein n=1 Tax=Microbulbifer guangxiensis TaxID=2904249 RepID=UPI001F226B58|nr:hypothetical protein [Microbulbifer guangxiensis]
MTPDEYHSLHSIIQDSISGEQRDGRFRDYLRDNLPGLHHTIGLPDGDGVLILTSFTIRYLETLPDWFEQMVCLCRTAGISTRILRRVFRRTFARAERLSLSRGQPLSLEALLPHGYLCHRLLEEANDRLHFALGIPLLPMDPQVANLVVRELIGEERATVLDRICRRAARDFDDIELASERVVALILARQCHSATPGRWPDFAGQMRIRLLIPELEPEAEMLH